jgi:3',5'-cyclic AMP phosphodiesterase CpdA
MFTLAHLSDLHVAPLPRPSPGQLLNKRLLGYLSWQRRRRYIHRADILAATIADIRARNPDHIAVTGDLVNISLPAEFDQAARYLHDLGRPENVSVIPGNHDAYIAMDRRQSWGRWAGYMTGDGPAGDDGGAAFPFIRRRGPVALIGLSSAVPTAPTLASGRLGHSQIAALGRWLQLLGDEGLFRIVLIHHCPLAGGDSWRKRLTDGAAFRRIIAGHGAELVLHGHNHRLITGRLAGPQGPVPVFGVPSASALRYKERPAAHHLGFTIEPVGRRWRLAVETRGYDATTGRFAVSAPPFQTMLDRPSAAAAPPPVAAGRTIE